MKNNRPSHGLRHRGFTLIEVMVGVVIFSLVMSALFFSFRTAVKTYQVGLTHADGDQAARFVMDTVAGDMRSLYYKTANAYNISRRFREQQQAERERQALQSGVNISAGEDPNLPELGPKIDLGFKCTDNADTDDLTFVRMQSPKRTEDRKPWNLVRLRYYVMNGNLYRSQDDIKAPEVDEKGNEIPKPYPPQVDKIANNVKSFDLKFGYYFEGEWHEAPEWDSAVTKYRNEVPDTEQDKKNPMANVMPNQQNQQVPPDNVPAWASITLTFKDPKDDEKLKTFHQVVQLPQSQETYVPVQADSTQATTQRSWSGSRAAGGRNR
ncbi:MAG: prepilin-type N-terminal cleavage/methylation domain-containing protein [Candidatus Sumerlaeaceae bacterium]|nr:prepilin-type N-terminal cleavage/methylation domain-containing protein [Candidatus Sumerlaeaceae bacterium]